MNEKNLINAITATFSLLKEEELIKQVRSISPDYNPIDKVFIATVVTKECYSAFPISYYKDVFTDAVVTVTHKIIGSCDHHIFRRDRCYRLTQLAKLSQVLLSLYVMHPELASADTMYGFTSILLRYKILWM